MRIIYPDQKKAGPPRTFLFPLILFFFTLCLSVNVKANTIVIGTGSGSITVDGMSYGGTPINPGDVLAITPGTYSGAYFNAIHDVTIINNGGYVVFTNSVVIGNNGGGWQVMRNITISGQTVNGDPYGIKFGTSAASFGGHIAIWPQNPCTQGLRIYNIEGWGVQANMIDAGGYGTTYTGDTNTLKLYRVSLQNWHLHSCGPILQGSWGAGAQLLIPEDSIDVGHIIIDTTWSNGNEINAGGLYRLHAHDWKINGFTLNPTGDVGVIAINGNGQVHHIQRRGGRGYIMRCWGQALNGQYGTMYAFDCIDVGTNAYGMFDIRSDSNTLTPAPRTIPYVSGCNFFVYNNTSGNKIDVNNYVCPFIVIGALASYHATVKNNLAFNNVYGANTIVNNNGQEAGNYVLDTSNNKYLTAAQSMIAMSDTVNCYLRPGSVLIDAGFPATYVTNDIGGIPRPQGGGWDIGAREYSSSTSFVTANAGNNQTISLPLDSATLNASGSSVVNSTITSYQWSENSGPNTAGISSPTFVGTKVTGLIAGTYVFSVKVKDANNDSSTATVTIIVNPVANLPPVVNAGTAQTITLPVNSVTLTGSATDPDGTISSYVWTQLSGPNTATIVSPSSASTNITGLIAGTYVFQLKAIDNNGSPGTASVTITVNPAPNQPPVPNAGANQTITLPTNSVSVNASASKDPDGTIASFAWTQVSGPASSTITNPTNVSTTITGLVQGTYIFKLTVTDNGGLSASDSITVTVNPATNQPPVANAGLSQTITLPLNSASLDGSNSSDPDGSIASYNWVEISGPSTATITGASTAKPLVSALIAGKYIFELTVTDNSGATSTAQVNITVNPATNLNPAANAGANQTITLPVNSVTVDGSASIAANGSSIVGYSWTEISGPSLGTIANPSNVSTLINNLVQGIYVFQLTVTDNNGNSGVDSVTITVKAAANIPPVSNAGSSVTITLPLDSVSLDGTKSYDPDGTISSYSWIQVSGPSTVAISGATNVTANVSNLIAGQYVFQLTVTDNSGASNSSQVKISVLPAANQLPVADAGVNQTITLPANTVILDGSKSYDPDGTIVSYNWTKASGTGAITINNSNTASATVSGLQAGSYVFKLTVADNSGATASAEVTVTVNAGSISNQAPVANAGNDTTIAVPANSATLNGSASTAPAGNIVSYSWTQISGPNSSVISSASSVVTQVNSLVAGTYVYQLTVTDNLGSTATDTVQVIVVDNNRLGSSQSLLLYPNPTSGIVNMQIVNDTTGTVDVIVYDMRGNIAMVKQYSKPSALFSTQIDASRLFGGTYLLHATISKKTVMIAKFVKQ